MLIVPCVSQIMLGQDVLSDKRLNDCVESGTQKDAMEVIGKIRAAIAAIKYSNHGQHPDFNGRLTVIVNNIGDQLRASQDAYNKAFSDDQTTIADFWSEWIRALYPWATQHIRTWGNKAIGRMRET